MRNAYALKISAKNDVTTARKVVNATIFGLALNGAWCSDSSTASATQAGVGLAQSAAGGTGTLSGQAAGLLGVGAQYGVILPFGRKQESEADVVGMDLAAAAGFDPRQTIPLWENMSRTGQQKPPEFLSTHPSDETRSANLKKNMEGAMEIFEEVRGRGVIPDCGF